MIHEYAARDLGGARGITAALGITGNQQARLAQSANNLSPMDGGRHVGEHKKTPQLRAEEIEIGSLKCASSRWLASAGLAQPFRCRQPVRSRSGGTTRRACERHRGTETLRAAPTRRSPGRRAVTSTTTSRGR
jgi:hypothetical protein